jgi:hypothetical protein
MQTIKAADSRVSPARTLMIDIRSDTLVLLKEYRYIIHNPPND